MRTIPVDAERVRLISTGNVSPQAMWVELSDGSRRPDPNGRQAIDEATGDPVWTVEVIAPADDDDERDKTQVIQVTVTSQMRPEPGPFGELVRFTDLTTSTPYLNKRTQQLSAPRWTATAVASARMRSTSAA